MNAAQRKKYAINQINSNKIINERIKMKLHFNSQRNI